MLTVIFATKEWIGVFEKFKTFLRPLCSKDIVFCPWNREGKTVSEMVPDLYKIIAFHHEWRAIVVNEDGLDSINPFDYTRAVDSYRVGQQYDAEKLLQRRTALFESYEAATNNPLTKLTTAFCGAPTVGTVLDDPEIFRSIEKGELSLIEYTLSLQLDALDVERIAATILSYEDGTDDGDGNAPRIHPIREKMKSFTPNGDDVDLVGKIASKDVAGILSLIRQTAEQSDGKSFEDRVLDLIRFLGQENPVFVDPEYVECMVENTKKAEMIARITAEYEFNDVRPTEVFCLAPRTVDADTYAQDVKWQDHDEHFYSEFAERNLYPGALKYMVFDLLPKEDKQYLSDQIRMLGFLLVLAGNPIPHGTVAPKRVYRVNLEFDSGSIGSSCTEYLNKLRATTARIKEISDELRFEETQSLDNEQARQLFESNVTVPVAIRKDLKKKDLFCNSKGLGLATDCPDDELGKWSSQYQSISKLFVRYLREPRRSVKTSVQEKFHKMNTVDDERALLLNEFQKEDIAFRLVEEEQNMVETQTSQIFNTAEFNRRMEEADKSLRRNIAQRMTRAKTLAVGGVALLAYLIGFLPLLFSNLNDTPSFLWSLLLVGIVLALFAGVGIVALMVYRRRLRNRFKHFNYVMSGITGEIDESLGSFSKYLSHACNVMREFSVLNYTESAVGRKQRILKKHELDVAEKTREACNIFATYLEPGHGSSDVEPYDYDFTLMRNYSYEMEHPTVQQSIEFMQPGYTVQVPVDYIKSVSLTREELYD